jgi:hypothetical protein
VDAFRVGRTRKFARENEAQQTAKRKQDEALVIEVDEEDTQAAPPLSPPVHLHKVRVRCSVHPSCRARALFNKFKH